MVLVCHLILQKLVIEGSSNFMGGSQIRQLNKSNALNNGCYGNGKETLSITIAAVAKRIRYLIKNMNPLQLNYHWYNWADWTSTRQQKNIATSKRYIFSKRAQKLKTIFTFYDNLPQFCSQIRCWMSYKVGLAHCINWDYQCRCACLPYFSWGEVLIWTLNS